MRMKILAAALLLAAVPAGIAFAGGAGGVLYGIPYFDPAFSNANVALRYTGGFGYAIDGDGRRFGGFGMGFFGDSEMGGMAGGVGGVVSGQEFQLGPITLAVNVMTGLGGIGNDAVGMPGGYLIGFAQVDAECGVALWPWMRVSVYGGMQGMTNLLPGIPLQSFLYYTPVVGVRVAWGGFPNG